MIQVGTTESGGKHLFCPLIYKKTTLHICSIFWFTRNSPIDTFVLSSDLQENYSLPLLFCLISYKKITHCYIWSVLSFIRKPLIDTFVLSSHLQENHTTHLFYPMFYKKINYWHICSIFCFRRKSLINTFVLSSDLQENDSLTHMFCPLNYKKTTQHIHSIHTVTRKPFIETFLLILLHVLRHRPRHFRGCNASNKAPGDIEERVQGIPTSFFICFNLLVCCYCWQGE